MNHINQNAFALWYQGASFQYERDTLKENGKTISVEIRVTVDGRFKVWRGKVLKVFDNKEEAIEFYNKIFEGK